MDIKHWMEVLQGPNKYNITTSSWQNVVMVYMHW